MKVICCSDDDVNDGKYFIVPIKRQVNNNFRNVGTERDANDHVHKSPK